MLLAFWVSVASLFSSGFLIFFFFLPPSNWDHKAHLVSREFARNPGQGRPSWESGKEFDQILASALSHEPGRIEAEETKTTSCTGGIRSKVFQDSTFRIQETLLSTLPWARTSALSLESQTGENSVKFKVLWTERSAYFPGIPKEGYAINTKSASPCSPLTRQPLEPGNLASRRKCNSVNYWPWGGRAGLTLFYRGHESAMSLVTDYPKNQIPFWEVKGISTKEACLFHIPVSDIISVPPWHIPCSYRPAGSSCSWSPWPTSRWPSPKPPVGAPGNCALQHRQKPNLHHQPCGLTK